MQDDTTDEDKPVYSTYQTIYRGEAIGGPKNGDTITSTNLTEFVPRKVDRKAFDYNGRSVMGLSVQERNQIAEAEKALMKETIWAREHPHRYDFDTQRHKWVYVEYTLMPLEE